MAILNKGHTFSSGDNVTATKLNDSVDAATFASGAVDDSTLQINNDPGGDGSLRIKDLGVSNAKLANSAVTTTKIGDDQVTYPKIQNVVTANRVLGSTTADGEVSEVQVQTDMIANGAVTADKIATSAQSVLMPTGTIITFAGTSAPSGYLTCNGGNFNTYTYRDLHAVISNTYGGTAYNAGVTDDPSATTTFKVPDIRGRVIAGWGGSLLAGTDSLALTGGVKSVTLTSAQSGMPAHSVSVSIPKGASYDGGNPSRLTQSPTDSGSLTVTGSVAAQNASSSHTNVQPTIILNYLIKT